LANKSEIIRYKNTKKKKRNRKPKTSKYYGFIVLKTSKVISLENISIVL